MKIVNPAAVARFHGLPACELCGQPAGAGGTEAAHVFARAMGGSGQLDHPINLIGLGGGFSFCNCHGKHHNSGVTTEQLLAVVGKREGWEPAEIEEIVYLLRRTPKEFRHLCANSIDGSVMCGHREPINTCDTIDDVGCPLCKRLFVRMQALAHAEVRQSMAETALKQSADRRGK